MEEHDVDKRRRLLALRWVCYALVLVVCYLFQTNRGMFSLGGIRPLWLPAACLVLAAFEGAFPSAVYGMFAGLLWDMSANRLAGFFAALLLIGCFLVSSVIQLTLRRTWFNVAALCMGWLFVVTGIDYLFIYALFNLPQRGSYYLGTLLPTIVYTAAVTALLYPLYRLINRIGQPES